MAEDPASDAPADGGEEQATTARWAASGAMALTGRPDGPALGPPRGLVAALDRLARPFPGVDPLALLVERAAIAGLQRGGTTTCGGAGRLLRSRDGWLAVSLPRIEDVDLLPAWLAGTAIRPARDARADPPWAAIAAAVRRRTTADLEERATLLGLAVSGVGTAPTRPAVVATSIGAAAPTPPGARVRVVDLSALWAGPLCGALLAGTGAAVVKVESTNRPDGARNGPAAFYDRLNGAKPSVAFDLTTSDGVDALRDLIRQADVVIEGSRPRALRQLGLDANALTATGPRLWISITGHGRNGDPGRVGFGDDAAVGGGLVVDDGRGPLFCADAIADPCTGLLAAGACLDALASGGRWLLDIGLSAVAASLAGPTLAVPAGLVAAPPPIPPPTARAALLGADTARVRHDFGLDR